MNEELPGVSRRHFLNGLIATGLAGSLAPCLGVRPAQARANANPKSIALTIGDGGVALDGRAGRGTLVNGTLPGPVLRFSEGDEIHIAVTNHLGVDSSIHWHGILLPSGMDGVPGLSFAGIRPGETFDYRFPLRQSGTYWYHSHSGLQEQTGVYGALIIDPAGEGAPRWDREHVIVLSDWTFEDPKRVLTRLKQQSHYYNLRQPVLVDYANTDRPLELLRERLIWARMRMDPSDIADVSAATYDYLLNGQTTAMNWSGLFVPGERVLLRIINAAAMTFFDFRIPGLELEVVSADGQAVDAVRCDEIRLGVAETYDVIVTPGDAPSYAVFAESMDRSGCVGGTLARALPARAALPPRRDKPMRDMRDMGMAGHAGHAMSEATAATTDSGHRHHGAMTPAAAAVPAYVHGPDRHGPGADMVSEFPRSRLDEPGVGLDNMTWRVLRYSELRASGPWPDRRPAEREMELHLTGNMARYMWSFDGVRFQELEGPLEFLHGERLRLYLVNDTMMEHPIHLHGMWMELDNGNGAWNPRKHTVIVKPAERLSVLITADAPGMWAFHCHLLYHMHMGMMHAVQVA